MDIILGIRFFTTLSCKLKSRDETLAILLIGQDYDDEKIIDIQGYFNSLVRNAVFKHVKNKIEKYEKHIVKIECNQCPYDLSICKENKMSLINLGYEIISKHYYKPEHQSVIAEAVLSPE